MSESMSNSFLLGAVAMASLVAAMFFARFWRRTGDRFFLLFALAFAIDAASRTALEWYQPLGGEQEPMFYSSRLVMFGLIVWAIVAKNAGGGKRPPPGRTGPRE